MIDKVIEDGENLVANGQMLKAYLVEFYLTRSAINFSKMRLNNFSLDGKEMNKIYKEMRESAETALRISEESFYPSGTIKSKLVLSIASYRNSEQESSNHYEDAMEIIKKQSPGHGELKFLDLYNQYIQAMQAVKS